MNTKEKSIKYRFQLVNTNGKQYVMVIFAKTINVPSAEALHHWLIEKFTCNEQFDHEYENIVGLIERIEKSYYHNLNYYIQGNRSVVHLTEKGVHVFDTYYECDEELTKKYRMKLETGSFLLLLTRLRENIKYLEQQMINDVDTEGIYTLEMKNFHT